MNKKIEFEMDESNEMNIVVKFLLGVEFHLNSLPLLRSQNPRISRRLTKDFPVLEAQELKLDQRSAGHENLGYPVNFVDVAVDFFRGKVLEIPDARLEDHAFDQGALDAPLDVVEGGLGHRHARRRLQDGVPVEVFGVDGSLGTKVAAPSRRTTVRRRGEGVKGGGGGGGVGTGRTRSRRTGGADGGGGG